MTDVYLVPPAQNAEIVKMMTRGEITRAQAKELLTIMIAYHKIAKAVLQG